MSIRKQLHSSRNHGTQLHSYFIGTQWRPQGGRGEASPYGRTSKNYIIFVCFHCHGTSSYHTTNTLQGRRAKSHVDIQTMKAHTYYITFGRPPMGGKLPPSPLAAPLVDGDMRTCNCALHPQLLGSSMFDFVQPSRRLPG